ncbi:hypothetical protein C8R42DRAFT_725609 [Lentinula raphanica]|nr:hypothetical protein C8R42DRAFT_725609 [Lentinula raphanica]
MSLAYRAFAYHARVRRRPSSFWFYFCFNSLLKIILRLLFRKARCLFDLPSDVIHFLAFSSPTPLSLVFYTHNSTNDSCTQKSHARRAPAIRARVEWQPYGNLPPSGSTSVSTPSSSKFPGSISANSPHSLAPTSPISAALCDAEPPKQQHPQSIFLTHLLRPNILVQEPCLNSLKDLEISYACLFREARGLFDSPSQVVRLPSRNTSLCFKSKAGYAIG